MIYINDLGQHSIVSEMDKAKYIQARDTLKSKFLLLQKILWSKMCG